MAKLLPPRPHYAKERALYPYPILAAFLLLFVARIADRFLGIDLGTPGNAVLLSVVVFLLPSLLFIRARGRGYAATLRLHRPYATHIPVVICAFFVIFSGTALLSILFGGTSSLGNSTAVFEKMAPSGLLSALWMAPVFAILPAVVEELLFRGVLCTELDRRGMLRTVLVGSLLFALIHFDLANLPVYFFAGVILTLVLYATDSLIATMILHGAYNLLSLFGQRYLNAFYAFTGSIELFLFFLVLVLLLSLFFFTRECARLYRLRAQQTQRSPRRDIPGNVQLYTMLDALCEWPVLLCMALSIAGFILFA